MLGVDNQWHRMHSKIISRMKTIDWVTRFESLFDKEDLHEIIEEVQQAELLTERFHS